MQPSTFKTTPDKITALDSQTLFLLRVRAMEDIPGLQTNRRFHSIDELTSHISTLTESAMYFRELKYAIGTNERGDKRRRRIALKINNVWNEVSHFLSHQVTVGKLGRLHHIDYLPSVFGFASVDEMIEAAETRGFKYEGEGKVDVDVLDCIAMALGFRGWIEFAEQDEDVYLISESVLQRMYGLHKCKSTLRESTLNSITQYICDMNWREYNTPEGREKAYKSIVGRLVKPEMKTHIASLYDTKAKTTPIPGVKDGDRITVTHPDGSTETYEYRDGNYHLQSNNKEMCA